jgi:integrase
MARHCESGVRGLFKYQAEGRREHWFIDLKWVEKGTGERRRYREQLPAGITASAAKKHALTCLNSALAGGWHPEREDSKRLRAALDEYLKWAETNRPLTHKDRTHRANVLCKYLGDSTPLDELSAFRIEKMKRDGREAGAQPATVNRWLALLKHFVGYADEHEWMRADVAARIRRVKLMKEPPGRVRYLTDDERERLDAAMAKKPVVSAIVLTALLSGMRRGEVLQLRREAVDMPAKTITLRRTKTNRVRAIPINEELAAVLTDALSRSEGSEFVFLNRRGVPYSEDGFRTTWDRVIADAKLEDFHFHDTRHDFATRLRRRGTGLDVIAKLLGHSTLQMTARYAHIVDDTLREAVAKLDAPKPLRAVP